MKRTFVLVNENVRRRCQEAVWDADPGDKVTIRPPTRSLDQNAAQWPYLAGFEKQKQLCINGEMQWVTDDDWKDVLTACWNGEMRMALYDGKVIMLPQRTSKMDKKVFSVWMDFLIAMAAQAGVEPIYKNVRKEYVDQETREIV